MLSNGQPVLTITTSKPLQVGYIPLFATAVSMPCDEDLVAAVLKERIPLTELQMSLDRDWKVNTV